MLEIRRDEDIYHADGGWFRARWHFSFDAYRDPHWNGVGPLRVFNHDQLAPGAIWPMHPHADIEGITYVWKGTFRHADSLGNGGVLHPGAVQVMTLGSGAEHSEQNASPDEPMEFLQLWILPDTANLPPQNQQRQFTRADRINRLLRVIGPDGGDVVRVHQDASVYVAALDAGCQVAHRFGPGRGGYAYIIEGAVTLDDEKLMGGDSARIVDHEQLCITAHQPSELVLVDVPLRWQPVGVWAS
jgi:redox-sensitive bicupin YhaK (pirin superfamily)